MLEGKPKYQPTEEEKKVAEASLTLKQDLDSTLREVSINSWENRRTPEALRTEFQALLKQMYSFQGKVSSRSFSGKDRQERFKDEAGIDPVESNEYYNELKKIRKEFIQQLNNCAREAGFSDTLDTMPNM